MQGHGDLCQVPWQSTILAQVTQAHYLCYVGVSYNMSKYGEHMGRRLGLEICWKMEITIDETYHVASYCP